MELTRVASSMMYAAGYDREQQTMEIVFYSGIYRYHEVPEALYLALLAAESKGRYMHEHVLGRYRYERLRGGKESGR